MTKNIEINDLPEIIRNEMIKDVTSLIKNEEEMDGRNLMYRSGTDDIVYAIYFIKNVAGKLEEFLFATSDIIKDYRKPAKSLSVLGSLLDL